MQAAASCVPLAPPSAACAKRAGFSRAMPHRLRRLRKPLLPGFGWLLLLGLLMALTFGLYWALGSLLRYEFAPPPAATGQKPFLQARQVLPS